MFTFISSNMIYNNNEYFTYFNIYLLFLLSFIFLFFMLINITLLYYSCINFNNNMIEFISTFFSSLLSLLIISPSLIILLNYELMIMPSFIMYPMGIQWSWMFQIIFLRNNFGFINYVDHHTISSNDINSNIYYSVCYYQKYINYSII